MAESQTAPQRYRIAGKFIYRASTQEVTMGTRPDGSPNIVRQPGPMEKLDVGTIVEDITPHELAAYGDRLELVTDDEVEAQQQAQREAGVLPMTFAPERGVHEPTGGPNTLIQQPPPSGEDVAAMKAGQAAVRKLEADQAEQRTKLDKELEEARAKAMTDAAEVSLRTPPARTPSRTTPAPASGATTAASSATETHDTGSAARRPGSRAAE